MRQDHKEAEAGIARLLELVEKGLMDAEDASMRERLVNLRFRRDELADQISDLTRRLAMAEPMITPEKIEKVALLLREKLHNGPPDLRQAYARLLLNEVRVDDREIRISGSKAVLARSATGDVAKTTPAVLSFVREWRTRQDSKLPRRQRPE
jgi:site-specific DNA recombinase